MRETQVWSLGQKDPVEKEMATCSSILVWEVQWTEEPGRQQSTGGNESDTTRELSTHAQDSTAHWPPILDMGELYPIFGGGKKWSTTACLHKIQHLRMSGESVSKNHTERNQAIRQGTWRISGNCVNRGVISVNFNFLNFFSLFFLTLYHTYEPDLFETMLFLIE